MESRSRYRCASSQKNTERIFVFMHIPASQCILSRVYAYFWIVLHSIPPLLQKTTSGIYIRFNDGTKTNVRMEKRVFNTWIRTHYHREFIFKFTEINIIWTRFRKCCLMKSDVFHSGSNSVLIDPCFFFLMRQTTITLRSIYSCSIRW